jgi:hypothetical protein
MSISKWELTISASSSFEFITVTKMSLKRSYNNISASKAQEDIDKWIDEEEDEEADNLHELYGEEDDRS